MSIESIQHFLQAHPLASVAAAYAAGIASANVGAIVVFLVHLLFRFPFTRAIIMRDPKRAKEIMDMIEEALDKEVDAEAAKAAQAAVVAPPAPPPVAKAPPAAAALLILGLLALAAAPAGANPYFRFMGMKDGTLHPTVGAGISINPNDLSDSVAVPSDLAIITHSVDDGTIIPDALQKYFPPTAWTPFSIWYGGSLSGKAVGGYGTSLNVSPAISALLLSKVSSASSGWAGALKKALDGSSSTQIRLGYALSGTMLDSGKVLPVKDMFPGQGLPDIIKRGSRLMVGAAWTF
jgi:hypothetical protein